MEKLCLSLLFLLLLPPPPESNYSRAKLMGGSPRQRRRRRRGHEDCKKETDKKITEKSFSPFHFVSSPSAKGAFMFSAAFCSLLLALAKRVTS